jgi:hypothetical protein
MARIGGIDPSVADKYHTSDNEEPNFVVPPIPGFRQLQGLWNWNHA